MRDLRVGAADVLPCDEPHQFDIGLDRCFVVSGSYLDLERMPEELFLDVLIPTEAGRSSGDGADLCYVYLESGLSMNQSWAK